MITMMTTKDDDKSDEQKAQVNQRTSISSESKNIHLKRIKNKSRVQESRRIQDSRRKPRIKNQDSRFKISRIKIKIQDSRFKNEEKTQSR